MPRFYSAQSSGGKGNKGMFIERDPKVCAAGIPSAQPEQHVADSLKHYLLQEEADALIHDAIIPPVKPRPPGPLRHQPLPDMRNAGPFSEVSELVNPPVKTKFQTLVEDLKNTSYTSYWRKNLGTVPDPVPTLPEGFDIHETTFGIKTPYYGRLYDTVMPVSSLPNQTPDSKLPALQQNRNYCKPAYNPNNNFGLKANVDPRGIFAKCCLTDDNVIAGTCYKARINTKLADYQEATQARLGVALTPNNNIKSVPKDFTFGKLKPPDNLPECLTNCDINPVRDLFKKCLGHLNTLRKCLSKRFEATYFKDLYFKLKYFDKCKSGWLPKDFVYNFCFTRFIRFTPSLLEPLLSLWNAFDGEQIDYKMFVLVINYREPSPELPKIWDIPDKCINFKTTYTEMTKPGQQADKKKMAGLPSGRYFDKDYPVTPQRCCKADRSYLPHESDAKSCLCPSIFTNLGISHRDIYTKREALEIRKMFESAGEKFTDDTFNYICNKAKNYHSQGWICIETFRKALEEASVKRVTKNED